MMPRVPVQRWGRERTRLDRIEAASPGDRSEKVQGERTAVTIWSIHYLRAVAALGVVIFHCLDGTGWSFTFGAGGIHLFFTISGFLMWSIAEGRPRTPRAFLKDRIVRIVPLYWIATFVAVLSTFLFPGYFWQATREPLIVAKSLFFIPQIGLEGGIYPVLYQGWTLQYEMFFYAVFTICLLFPRALRIPILSTILITLVVAGIGLAPTGPVLRTYTDPICIEFLAGVLVARLACFPLRPRTALALSVVGWVTFIGSYKFEKALYFWSDLIIPLSTGSIVLGMVMLERSGRMVHWRWLRFTGEASYSIYLFQTLGFAIAATLFPDMPALVQVIIYTAAALAMGVLTFMFIERPMIKLMKGRYAVAVASAWRFRADSYLARSRP